MKSFAEIMRTSWWDLSSNELKYYSLGLFLECVVLSLFTSVFIAFLIGDFNYLLISFVGLSFSSLIIVLIIYKRDYLNEKYVLFDMEYPGISYQGLVFILFGVSGLLSTGAGILAFKQGGLYSAIAFSLIEFFPPIFMFLRLKVFSNENRGQVYDFKDNQTFGFHPLYYYMLSLMVCNGPMGVSLLWIFKSIFQNRMSLSYSLFYFALSFCLFCFVLSPDKVNKILPFELKTGKGFKKFAFLALILAVLLLILMM